MRPLVVACQFCGAELVVVEVKSYGGGEACKVFRVEMKCTACRAEGFGVVMFWSKRP